MRFAFVTFLAFLSVASTTSGRGGLHRFLNSTAAGPPTLSTHDNIIAVDSDYVRQMMSNNTKAGMAKRDGKGLGMYQCESPGT